MTAMNSARPALVALLAASCCFLCGCNLVGWRRSPDRPAYLGIWSPPWLGSSGGPGWRRRHKRAEPEGEAASRELNGESRAHVLVAWGLALEQAGQLDQATEAFEQALKAAPKSKRALLALARNYARVGRPEAALTIYRRAAKLYNHDAGVYNDLGLHLAEMRRWDQAIEALEKATELDPFTSRYHNNLGLVLAMSGRFKEALSEFRAAVGPAKAHYNLARVRLYLGDRAGARHELQRAIALMPQFKEAKQLLAELERGEGEKRLLTKKRPSRRLPEEEKAIWPASHVGPPETDAVRLAANQQQASPLRVPPARRHATLGKPVPVTEQGARQASQHSRDPWSEPFLGLDWLE